MMSIILIVVNIIAALTAAITCLVWLAERENETNCNKCRKIIGVSLFILLLVTLVWAPGNHVVAEKRQIVARVYQYSYGGNLFASHELKVFVADDITDQTRYSISIPNDYALVRDSQEALRMKKRYLVDFDVFNWAGIWHDSNYVLTSIKEVEDE